MRYKKTKRIINNSSMYGDVFFNKGVKTITQYSSFNFRNLKNIDDYGIDYITHVVQPFDRLYMISQKYYQSPDYGWLICYTNQISNELDINPGLELKIYFPLDSVLELS